jgi:resuscitation-promoting factor RpfA
MSTSSRTLYSGRHRTPATPNRAARALVGVSAAGAVVATPLAIASPAQAATGRTWDRLAACESGGNWGINTGNGYYGGLQFSSQTWRAFGGGKYASSAHRASRSAQIAVAEKVLDAQGWGAWPACSRKLGLTRADAAGSAKVSRSSQRTAVKAKKKSTTSSKASVTRSTATRGAYVVRSGDTLSKIASRKHVRGGWKALYLKNKRVIGSSPNHILVGQRLLLPR